MTSSKSSNQNAINGKEVQNNDNLISLNGNQSLNLDNYNDNS